MSVVGLEDSWFAIPANNKTWTALTVGFLGSISLVKPLTIQMVMGEYALMMLGLWPSMDSGLL